MPDTPYHVLILCTGNSARSIMAEALINTLGKGRFRAHSAGSHPSGKVNPFAVEKVLSLGYTVERLRSKSWDEFAKEDAPTMDFVITVCDNAAGEICPVWPGLPITAHWGFADPAAVEGSDEDKRQAFDAIFQQITACVERLVELPLDGLDKPSIARELAAIANN